MYRDQVKPVWHSIYFQVFILWHHTFCTIAVIRLKISLIFHARWIRGEKNSIINMHTTKPPTTRTTRKQHSNNIAPFCPRARRSARKNMARGSLAYQSPCWWASFCASEKILHSLDLIVLNLFSRRPRHFYIEFSKRKKWKSIWHFDLDGCTPEWFSFALRVHAWKNAYRFFHISG